MSTLYETIKAAGIPHDSHESDLYLPRTKQVLEILDKFPLQKSNATTFKSQIDGKQWLDVPFAFLPFWEAKARTIIPKHRMDADGFCIVCGASLPQDSRCIYKP